MGDPNKTEELNSILSEEPLMAFLIFPDAADSLHDPLSSSLFASRPLFKLKYQETPKVKIEFHL